ncbi:hypothetical protein C9I57_14160 [Trinickia symbiotica]|uniref:non-specific protein-tyrosine kinase n=1 Tax=Trinickia symbiotica TaxID=863227 RepID=A0A2T3XUM0_9BURK|nr:polysaccharide biosynthesis tyrosine autokinase [Trinickia symbiotica]PTB20219.1 hypothetical protein C9I57_14160 [Trinickia symbiotica]
MVSMINKPDQTDLILQDRELAELRLAYLWYNLCDHWKSFLSIVFAVLAIVGLYAILTTPVYHATVLLQVDKKHGTVLGALADVTNPAVDTNGAIDGELDVITSRKIVDEAIRETHLDTRVSVVNYVPLLGRLYARWHRPPRDTLAQPVLGLSDFAWGGERLAIQQFDVPEELYGKGFYLTVGQADHWVLRDQKERVVADGKTGELKHFPIATDYGMKEIEILVTGYLARPGTVFRIVKQSPNDAYAAVLKSMKVGETNKGSSMIRVTFSNADPSVAAAFLNDVANGYVALDIKHLARQATASLKYLQDKLPSLKQALYASEERLNEFRIRSRSVDFQQQTESLLTREVDLKRQRTTVEMNLQANSKIFQPDHPVIVALENQLRGIDKELQSIDVQVKELPPTQQAYVRLSRDVSVNTQLYTSLLANAQQLEVAAAGTTGNVVVLDPASVPTKIASPNLPLLAIAGLVAGLFIAFVAVQFMATQRNVLKDVDQLESVSHVPLFGVIPYSKAQQRIIRAHDAAPAMLSQSLGNDPSVEALRSLRSTLKFTAEGKQHSVVLFTSPTPGAGKTFISTNFAYLLALSGRRVLVIDADMRRPSLKKYMPSSDVDGLAEVLVGALPLESAIQRGTLENLDYLAAARRLPMNPAELLDRPEFELLVHKLKAQYDHIVIDSPPVLPVTDSLLIAAHSDLVFLISRTDVTTERQLREAVGRFNTVGIPVTGHVFNGFKVARYGYGYEHAYQQYSKFA